jgi:glycine/D-amino acid oxidase-like deaminating enzyme
VSGPRGAVVGGGVIGLSVAAALWFPYHGGAGVTLSWGCAEAVAALVADV